MREFEPMVFGASLPQVLLVGNFAPGTLECSYKVGFESIGCKVSTFNLIERVEHYCRLGSAGQMFNRFVQVEPWIGKANRDLITTVLELHPDVVVTFGHHYVRVGSLAQIRVVSSARLIHVWPDPLLNVGQQLVACLPLFDLVATYSKASIPVFKRLGAQLVEWVPLAADPSLHAMHDRQLSDSMTKTHSVKADVSFIGGWRPEREHILSQLGTFDLKIWGTDWERRTRANPVIARAFQRRVVIGSDFAACVSNTKVNLNIIDSTNFAAPNMRFFEIPLAGGLQLSSWCPEMADEFPHGKYIFYYREPAEIADLVQHLLDNDHLRIEVARAAHEKVMSAHTYAHRARTILSMLSYE